MTQQTFPAIPFTPYYDHNGITLYCANNSDILPHLPKFDLVVTDPPYGMEFQSNYRAVKYSKIAGDSELPIETIQASMEKAIRAAYFFCRWDNLPDMPKPKSVLAWVKNNWSMGDLEHEHGRQWEACCFYPFAEHKFISRIPDVIYADRTGNNLHPTQKPESLIRKIIGANVGETILDPWCGSGTTLVAAKLEGRRAVGIEINERYCEAAANRLSQEVLF